MLSYTTLAVTVAEADAYAQARAWTAWTGEEAAKMAALRRGQDYIASTYNGRWSVEFDDTNAPPEVKYAIIEAAYREIVTPGSLAPDYVAAKSITRERVKVGAIEEEYDYTGAVSAASVRPQIAIIDNLLAPYLRQAFGASVDLLRV
jgi:hypothetical protein